MSKLQRARPVERTGPSARPDLLADLRRHPLIGALHVPETGHVPRVVASLVTPFQIKYRQENEGMKLSPQKQALVDAGIEGIRNHLKPHGITIYTSKENSQLNGRQIALEFPHRIAELVAYRQGAGGPSRTDRIINEETAMSGLIEKVRKSQHTSRGNKVLYLNAKPPST